MIKTTKSLSLTIAELLQHDKILTIHQSKEGELIVSFAEPDEYDSTLVYIPEQIMVSKSCLEEAMASFASHQDMLRVRGMQA